MEPEDPSASPPAHVTGSGVEESRGFRIVPPKVGYLGPEGTFSEEALLSSAAPDSVEPVPRSTIYDTVMALRDGEVEWAVVPIENSLDGSVSVTLDLLADEAEAVQIVGETLLTVRHSLIARQPLELREIDTVLSHPKVPGQCARFLRGELAHARILPASSTAEAVRDVVENAQRGQAALGTRLAADIYGGTIVRDGVQDRDDNETRFVWLAGPRSDTSTAPPMRSPGSRDGWKTSLVFWGAGADSPGWLVRCLDEFARRDINLTKIESRPRRERLGHYMFFVDLEGGLPAEQTVGDAVADVREMCEELRVLGSYPMG
jgi:prephenate dehydratase